MKNIALLFSILFTHFYSDAQIPGWIWARSSAGTRVDVGQAVETDRDGNIFTTGWFSSDSLPFTSNTIYNTSAGTNDCYVVKYDASANVVWAKRITGNSNEQGRAVVADEFGNLYVFGHGAGTMLDFGTLSVPGCLGGCMFIAKYDSSGNVIWARAKFGIGIDFSLGGNYIALDRTGHIYITGYITNSNPNTVFGNDTLVAVGAHDSFLAKLDTAGNEIWGRLQGGKWNDKGYGVATDPEGNIYLSGNFESDSMWVANVLLQNTLQGAWQPSYDFFMVKYNTSGDVIWAISHGGLKNEYGLNIAVDTAGHIAMAGYFESDTLVLGVDSLFRTLPGVFADMYVCKFDTSGNLLWVRSASSAGDDHTTGVAIEASGNVDVTGFTESSFMRFGNDTISGRMFIARYDLSGSLIFAKGAGGSGTAYNNALNGMTTDKNENIYITGRFGIPVIIFGTDTLIEAGGTGGASNYFVAKLGSQVTGLSPINKSALGIVYPNPSHGAFYISFPHVVEHGNLRIVNLLGKIVTDRILEFQQNIEMTSEDFQSGVYFVRVIERNEQYTMKLIVQ